MSSRKILKGASLLSFSEVVNQVCSLLRNIILARFLTKEDFGVAALLGMILTVFEMTSKMALGQQVVQSKHADEPAFINSVHFTQLTLSTLSALLILTCAWPLAHFFAGPQYLTSIMLLAVIPFLSGFGHLEIYSVTRRLSFGPMALAETIPQVVTTVAAWPLALYFRDYRAMLWLLVGRAILYMAMSHLLSKQRFSPCFNSHWLKESLQFGWPLLLSGFIQLGNFQGDSMVIAAGYTMAELGEFSVALTIAMAPGLILMKASSSVALPLLAEVQHNLAQLTNRYSRYVEMMALLACFATLGMVFCGEQIVTMLYGTKYAGIGLLACWLTVGQAIRIIRNSMGSVAMALGDTMNNLVSSTWRLSGLPLAIGVGLLHGSITAFAVTAASGEVIASCAVIMRLSSKHHLRPRTTLWPTMLGTGCVLIATTIKWVLPATPHGFVNWLLLIIAACFSTGVFMFCFSELRALVADFVAKINIKLGSPLPLDRWITSARVVAAPANLPNKNQRQ